MFNLFNKRESSGFFIPEKNGFREFTGNLEDGSFNGMSRHLGYHPDHVHIYFGDFNSEFEIQQVAFEIFTDNIIFIYTKKTVREISDKKLKFFLRDYKIQTEYDSIVSEGLLRTGIENKSMSFAFLKKVLGLKTDLDEGGIVFSERLGLYLYFSGGILVDLGTADGLNEWAKHIRNINPELFGAYLEVAKKYWGNKIGMVQDEINIQAEAFANTPHGFNNQFLELHRVELGTVNFLMLLVCHYGQKITEEQFTKINVGRYSLLDVDTNATYRYKDFILTFGLNGELISINKDVS
ncbi:MAG: hypothetical protein HOP30_19240 [Cyclobacteriaceae bacterium]|nr:hypothetical protein [Cyclobacteriaceae bacterium]